MGASVERSIAALHKLQKTLVARNSTAFHLFGVPRDSDQEQKLKM